ncbi:MAG: hypothetical protein ACK55I_04775, partial [bacterium]
QVHEHLADGAGRRDARPGGGLGDQHLGLLDAEHGAGRRGIHQAPAVGEICVVDEAGHPRVVVAEVEDVRGPLGGLGGGHTAEGANERVEPLAVFLLLGHRLQGRTGANRPVEVEPQARGDVGRHGIRVLPWVDDRRHGTRQVILHACRRVAGDRRRVPAVGRDPHPQPLG